VLHSLDMEEEAIVAAVGPGPQRVIDQSLHLEFLHVSFRVLAASKYRNEINKVTLKNPHWLAELQTSAPIDGYAMKNGEFTVSLPKDDRIKEDLRVILEVTAWDVHSESQ
jgi:hypothetical protein